MANEVYDLPSAAVGEALASDTSLWQRVRKPLTFVAGVAALGAAYGTYRGATDDTSIRLGPHHAYAHLTTDEALTVHFARDEYLTMPLDGPVFGADVTLGDVDMPLDSNGNPEFNSAVSEYVELFSANTDHLSEDTQNKIIDHMESAALLWGLLGSFAAIGALNIHLKTPERTRDALGNYLRSTARPAGRMALGLAAVATVPTMVMWDTYSPHSRQAQALESGAPTSGVFKDTFLEHASIHGNLLEGAINELAGPIIKKIQSANEYYGAASDQLVEQFHNKYGENFNSGEGKWALVLSDEHCNVGSFQFWGRAVQLFSPDFVLLAGDQTNDGTDAEGVCINNEAEALHGVPAIVAGGNHDSSKNAEQDRQNNIHADFGKVDEIAGFTVYTDTDPRLDSFGTERRKTNESDAQYRVRIKTDICRERPDIALIHDPGMVYAEVQQGCAKLTVSGHLHEQSGPFYVQTNGTYSYQFIQGTSGGIKSNMLSLLYFQNEAPAVGSLLKFDPETHELLGRIDITLNTDGTPEISHFISVSGAEHLPASSGEYGGQGD